MLKSTLLNNCKATNLVNNRNLLKPKSFIKSDTDNIIEYKSSYLLILRRGTRVLKNAFIRLNKNKFNFRLINVALIKSFYVNIISEARF